MPYHVGVYWGPAVPPLGMEGGVADPIAPFYLCYHVKFLRCRSKPIDVGREVPSKLGTWDPVPLGLGTAEWLTPRNALLPTCVTMPDLLVLGLTTRT